MVTPSPHLRSHACNFTAGDLFRLALLPIVVCFAFTATMNFGSASGFFPSPKPILDTDRTILVHQAEASRSRRAASAEIILIGDSSCLMDVNARELQSLTGKRALNLGTLSHVTLQRHGYLVNESLRSNTQPTTVVLLMHPESLRLADHAPYFDQVLAAYIKETDFAPSESTFLRLTGASTARKRFLTRALPLPLAGAYGQQYAFNQNLWNHLTENNGSALDPHTYPKTPPSGNPEYRLAPQLQSASTNFASRLPPNTRLVVGITPSPSDYVYRNHAENCRAMLATWSQWLDADAALTNLPFVLPPTHFATTTHLNARGVSEYTQLLADQINSPAP